MYSLISWNRKDNDWVAIQYTRIDIAIRSIYLFLTSIIYCFSFLFLFILLYGFENFEYTCYNVYMYIYGERGIYIYICSVIPIYPSIEIIDSHMSMKFSFVF